MPPAEQAKIDECKDWADKAQALASYAKQARDETLHKMALRIQARAIRRCGKLLKQFESATGNHLPNVKREGDLPYGREPKHLERAATLKKPENRLLKMRKFAH